MSQSTVTLREKPFKLFERSCLEGCEKEGKEKQTPFVDFSVSMTNSCNANCLFCCNAGKKEFKFDVEAFKDFFDETRGTIPVNKVTFTGGEPTLRLKELHECLDHIRGKCGLITVNTNGSRLAEMNHPAIHRIALSRHHYSDKVNDEIFGLKIGNPLIGSELKFKIALVCNLIKNRIDSAAEAYKMLEFAANNGIEDMSFVGLMIFNDFCRANQIPLESLQFGKDVLCTRRLSYEVPGICHCSNHIYVANNGEIVHYYMRHNMKPDFDKGSRVVWENNKIG